MRYHDKDVLQIGRFDIIIKDVFPVKLHPVIYLHMRIDLRVQTSQNLYFHRVPPNLLKIDLMNG
jgi:hypothetical protein